MNRYEFPLEYLKMCCFLYLSKNVSGCFSVLLPSEWMAIGAGRNSLFSLSFLFYQAKGRDGNMAIGAISGVFRFIEKILVAVDCNGFLSRGVV